MKKYIIVIFSIVLAFSLSASGQNETESNNIRIGVLPDAGTLPLFLIDNVEVITFMSAKDREIALQLGELDGVTTDLVSVVANNQKGLGQRVVTTTESRFIIVAHPEFVESSTWDIGISENTVIEFMVDQFTQGRDIEKIAIPQLPVRMEMLRNGKISMACLTDALAWSLLNQGFKIVNDQLETNLEPAVLAFSDEFISQNPEVIAKFKEDWNSAVNNINNDPEKYRNILIDEVRIPENTDLPYPVPEYHHIKTPNIDTVNTVLDWFDTKYGLEKSVNYSDLMVQ